MTTKIFPITGMTCGGCVRTVQTILKNKSGVSEALVQLEPDQAEITFNEAEISPEKMAEAIGKMGYAMQTANR